MATKRLICRILGVFLNPMLPPCPDLAKHAYECTCMKSVPIGRIILRLLISTHQTLHSAQHLLSYGYHDLHCFMLVYYSSSSIPSSVLLVRGRSFQPGSPRREFITINIRMHVLVHVYISTLIFFYFFILIIRFWDDIFGESADTRGVGANLDMSPSTFVDNASSRTIPNQQPLLSRLGVHP